MKIDTAVIPVAGLGTRMLPVSRLVPKEFLPLGRKPAIQLVAEELLAAGVRHFVFVVSPRKTSLQNLFGTTGNQLSGFEDARFEYVVQEEQLGLGHAVLCAANAVGNEPFAVALGDCLIGLPGQSDLLPRLIGASTGRHVVIGFEEVPRERVNRYGIAITSSTQQVFEFDGLVEKPKIDSAPSNLAVCGRYLFEPQIFDALRTTKLDKNREIQLTDAINQLVAETAAGVGVRVETGVKRYDIGNMESYAAAFVEFARQDPGLRNVIDRK